MTNRPSATAAPPAPSEAFSPSERLRGEAARTIARYPAKHAAILPLLWLVQRETGYVSREAMEWIARETGASAAHVYGVVTFYHMFRQAPPGKAEIQLCATIPCSLVGAKEIESRLRDRLGVKPGETTPDGRFTLKKMECLGLCEHAPAALVNETEFGRLSPEAIDAFLDQALKADAEGAGPFAISPQRFYPAPGFAPVLLKGIGGKDGASLAAYRAAGGYAALKKAIEMGPAAVLSEVKSANLRGRGGAGFPSGVKWGFMPPDPKIPKYLCVNADESEPGTFSNRVVMEEMPHLLLEGTLIAALAMGIRTAFIYIRGEYVRAHRRLEKAIEEAYAAKLIGKEILGSAFSTEVVLHRGAGAYICGEEMALMASLEGNRGEPRNKPPFPAQRGVFGSPTTINNVETLANVPHVIAIGASAYKAIGPEGSPGPKLICVSGHVKRPGLFELPMGVPMREVIETHAGGVRDGHTLKAVIPGGASAAALLPSEIDVAMDFDSMAKAGSILGTAGMVVMDETVCMVDAATNVTHFFAHESCGQCTPCREGIPWVHGIVKRLFRGQGGPPDLQLLANLFPQIHGKTICLFADFALTFLESVLKKFPQEFADHAARRPCPAQTGAPGAPHRP